MNLAELAAQAPQARAQTVPDWTLGCFVRRCITYANGAEDACTRVVWIQSHGLTGDIRIPADRPDVSARGAIEACSRTELQALALAEGGVADTVFADGRMTWSRWCALQPYDKWPEAGELRRVGGCLVEFAPSGAYVEDWRMQPDSGGLLVGLRLEAESRDSGPFLPRDGGLVIAGVHVLLSLGRTAPLESEAPLSEQIRIAADPAALARRQFEAETCYGRIDPAGGARVRLSTNPFREGGALDLEGFAPGAEAFRVTQDLVSDGVRVQRIWAVDTLLPDCPRPLATGADADGEAWLAREGPRLPGALPLTS